MMEKFDFKFSKSTKAQFHAAFIGNITKGRFNNTYKFALARFLLEYINQPNPSTQVRYKKISRYFFKYYWLQECKSKLRQGPKNQIPEVIQFINAKFPKKQYPDSYGKMLKKYPDKFNECVDLINKNSLHDVITRFQQIGKPNHEIFFKYVTAKEYKDSADNKKIDPCGGILINPKAIEFMQENRLLLYKAVILEWIRFLEARNFGIPNIVQKIEGRTMGKRDQRKFFKLLTSFSDKQCFYCGNRLDFKKSTHVDHVLPYDYVGKTELWNLVLACQKCNCKKSGSLPTCTYMSKLHKRNCDCEDKEMRASLLKINYGNQDINWHYKNAKSHGFSIWRFKQSEKYLIKSIIK